MEIDMKYNFTGYRSFRNQQEKKAYYDEPELVRAKRRPNNLPNCWENEYYIETPKSWKKSRTTQYRENRGARHEIVLPVDVSTWRLKEHLLEQDIPFVIEEKREKYLGKHWWSRKPYWYSRHVSFKLVWWSDKDIGINYILQKFNYE